MTRTTPGSRLPIILAAGLLFFGTWIFIGPEVVGVSGGTRGPEPFQGLEEGQYIRYELLSRNDRFGSINVIAGLFELRFTGKDARQLKCSLNASGEISLPRGSSGNIGVAYYNALSAFSNDTERGTTDNAFYSVLNSTNFRFRTNFTVESGQGSPDSTESGYAWNTSEELIYGISFFEKEENGTRLLAYFQNLILPSKRPVFIDPDRPPGNIRDPGSGSDLDYFGSAGKDYGEGRMEVHSYTWGDVFYMDFSAANGLLTFYGNHDLTLDGKDHLRYQITDTNIPVGVAVDPGTEGWDASISVKSYLPALFMISILCALLTELIFGRFATMEGRKKGIFVLVVLIIVASLVPLQLVLLAKEADIVDPPDEFLRERYPVRVSGIDWSLDENGTEKYLLVNLSLINEGKGSIGERNLEVIFTAEKFGIEIFTSSEDPGDDFAENPNYLPIPPGAVKTFNARIAIGKEDPRYVDLELRVSARLGTEEGNYEVLAERYPIEPGSEG